MVGYFFMFLTISITNLISSTRNLAAVSIIIIASKIVKVSPPLGDAGKTSTSLREASLKRE